MAIKRGDVVEATTAGREVVRLRALREPEQGRDFQGREFPVVWVCTLEDWDRAEATGEEPHGIPWPLDAVRELAAA